MSTTRPANDFRFEIVQNPEPDSPSDLYFVTVIELLIAAPDETWPCETLVDGDVLESFSTSDPWSAVEAAREAQAYTLEERIGEYGLEWEREQRDRIGC